MGKTQRGVSPRQPAFIAALRIEANARQHVDAPSKTANCASNARWIVDRATD